MPAVKEHVHPGGAVHPGHEHGVRQVGVGAQEVGVIGAVKHRALANGQPWHTGNGADVCREPNHAGHAEGGFEDLKGQGAAVAARSW